jgi:hypothetical protein
LPVFIGHQRAETKTNPRRGGLLDMQNVALKLGDARRYVRPTQQLRRVGVKRRAVAEPAARYDAAALPAVSPRT